MKKKVLEFVAGILLIGSITYIFGQAGALDCSTISITECMVHSGIGLVVLGFDTWLINHLGEEGIT